MPGVDRVQVLVGVLHINGEPVRRLKIEEYESFPMGCIPAIVLRNISKRCRVAPATG